MTAFATARLLPDSAIAWCGSTHRIAADRSGLSKITIPSLPRDVFRVFDHPNLGSRQDSASALYSHTRIWPRGQLLALVLVSLVLDQNNEREQISVVQ